MIIRQLLILMLGLVAVSGANTEEAFTLDVDDDGRDILSKTTVPSPLAKLSPSTYGVDEYWGQIVDFEQDVFF